MMKMPPDLNTMSALSSEARPVMSSPSETLMTLSELKPGTLSNVYCFVNHNFAPAAPK